MAANQPDQIKRSGDRKSIATRLPAVRILLVRRVSVMAGP